MVYIAIITMPFFLFSLIRGTRFFWWTLTRVQFVIFAVFQTIAATLFIIAVFMLDERMRSMLLGFIIVVGFIMYVVMEAKERKKVDQDNDLRVRRNTRSR